MLKRLCITTMFFIANMALISKEVYIIHEYNLGNNKERLSYDCGKTWVDYKKIEKIKEYRKDGVYQTLNRGKTWTKVSKNSNLKDFNKFSIINNNGVLSINYEELDDISADNQYNFEIYDLLGNKLIYHNLENLNKNKRIELQTFNLQSGLYFIIISNKSGYQQFSKIILT